MRYALLMSADPAHTEAMSQAEIDEVMRKHTALGEEIQPSGELVGGAGLAPRRRPRSFGTRARAMPP